MLYRQFAEELFSKVIADSKLSNAISHMSMEIVDKKMIDNEFESPNRIFFHSDLAVAKHPEFPDMKVRLTTEPWYLYQEYAKQELSFDDAVEKEITIINRDAQTFKENHLKMFELSFTDIGKRIIQDMEEKQYEEDKKKTYRFPENGEIQNTILITIHLLEEVNQFDVTIEQNGEFLTMHNLSFAEARDLVNFTVYCYEKNHGESCIEEIKDAFSREYSETVTKCLEESERV